MDIHVLTPFSRPANLNALVAMYQDQRITWHLIAVRGVLPSGVLPAWVHAHCCPEPPPTWDPCYWKLNWFIRTQAVEDGARYAVFCDDDGFEPGYFHLLRGAGEVPVLITRMNGGQRQPRGSAHPAGEFLATAAQMRPGMVGFQFAISGAVLRTVSFANRRDADGQMAEFLTTFYRTEYLSQAIKRFNWLEPGRWAGAPLPGGQ
jgi:hypothetical protein